MIRTLKYSSIASVETFFSPYFSCFVYVESQGKTRQFVTGEHSQAKGIGGKGKSRATDIVWTTEIFLS